MSPVNLMLTDGSDVATAALKSTQLAAEILELNYHTSVSKYEPYSSTSEVYLEPSGTSTIELFCENS